MGYISVTCPNCGAAVALDESHEYGYCSFCGSKITRDKIIVEHQGNVSISGTVTEESLTERGYIFIDCGEFEEGIRYFDKVLDINPKSFRAYLGKLLCQLRIKDEKLLAESPVPPENCQSFNLAVRFADEKDRERMLGYNDEAKAGIEKKLRLAELACNKASEEYKTALDAFNVSLDKYKRLDKYSGVFSALSSISLVLFLIAVFFCFFDFFENLPLALISFAVAVGSFKYLDKCSNARKQLDEDEKKPLELKQKVDDAKDAYDLLLRTSKSVK